MERKFELTCTRTVWSIVGCPFSLCRRPTFSSPHPNFGKVALWKLHTTRQKTQNCSWASSTLFSPGKSSALKRKIKPDCYETGYTCWHILLRAKNGKELITHRVRVQSSLWTDCEQALCLGKSSPQRRCVFRTEEHQNPSKTAEKWLFCHIFVTHSTYRKRLRASGDVPCASEDMACGYWFSKWRTTKSIWVR